MMTLPVSSKVSRPKMSNEQAILRLKRAGDAVDEHNTEVALRLLIEVAAALVERIPASSG